MYCLYEHTTYMFIFSQNQQFIKIKFCLDTYIKELRDFRHAFLFNGYQYLSTNRSPKFRNKTKRNEEEFSNLLLSQKQENKKLVKKMWLSSAKGSSNFGRRNGKTGLVAVAIDKDKRSQDALKWATENLISKGQTIILIHVVQRPPPASRT